MSMILHHIILLIRQYLVVVTFLLGAALFLPGCIDSQNDSRSEVDAARTVYTPQQQTSRPNILLVVLDDVGFTDLGAWGGVIRTPNMDALAREGLLFTNFHVAPNCSPTRAMLLSGTDSHVTGLGAMGEGITDNQRGQPGYEGYLNFQIAALPELLRDAGYHTYMTGKWHLGLTTETDPAARGFERSFALLQGGAGAFSNMLPLFGPGKAKYHEDGRLLDSLPDDFYSTAFYTERMIDYIDAGQGDGRPFFAYLAYTAPHWPLQAPAESIARYRGKFDQGYDAYREERLSRLKELGFIAQDVEAFSRLPGEPAWDELTVEQQRVEARRMEIYAAMVDDVDRYFGRLLDHLKAIGQYENTFVFFMSDNGPEGHELSQVWPDLAMWAEECCDNSYANMGQADSYIWYGQNWGQAGTVPHRMYKGYTSQGGVNVPAIASFPQLIAGDRRSPALIHVSDVMPTILELAGVAHPGAGHYRDREIVAMQGKSMLALLKGEADTVHGEDYFMAWELFGKRAVRQGDWKVIYEPYHELREMPAGISAGVWQLYNLKDDPAELNDLSADYPDKLREMIALWELYAETNNVILPDSWSSY